MPSSQAAANERRNERIATHEPPKLKTTLKTPPKQATNPLQFVKVGPCSLYRTAQEQLQKVQEVKKIKPEVRDDPEDWQSNLDNWKSSRRKRQEHIIERVVEVKKLELEEHDRQRRRSKTFSEMMEERGSRGRKLSMSIAMYHEEDANDLSDLGIGTSSGKSSVSGDTHDDMQSVLSDRDSEIEKNHSDVENASSDNVNSNDNPPNENVTTMTLSTSITTNITPHPVDNNVDEKPTSVTNGFHNNNDNRDYDSGTTATVSSPEPEEYTYEGAIRGYVSRVTQNIPRRSLANLDPKLDSATKKNTNDEKKSFSPIDDEKTTSVPAIKVDVIKRREIFEKASQNIAENRANSINNNHTNNNKNNINLNNNSVGTRSSSDFSSAKSIKERLSCLERQNSETEISEKDAKATNRLSGDMSSIRQRLSHLEKQTSERENKVSHRKTNSDEFENVRPLRERLSTLEKYKCVNETSSTSKMVVASPIVEANRRNDDEDSTMPMKKDSSNDKTTMGSVAKPQLGFHGNRERRMCEDSTTSERSSSPDSEYRATRATFHRSLDSLDADASSGPDTFERVQSLEELDYGARYPASSSSAEILNDTDREDSGIHTADVSCSVSQADEPVDEDDPIRHPETIVERQESIAESADSEETSVCEKIDFHGVENNFDENSGDNSQQESAVTTKKSIVIDSTDEEAEYTDEASVLLLLPVDHEEPTTDAKPMDHLATIHDSVSDDAISVGRQHEEQLPNYEIHEKPEIDRHRTFTTLTVDASSAANNISDFVKSDENVETQVNKMEFFGAVSPSSKQIPQLNLASDEEFVTGMTFPLGPLTTVEPPKEKPPPPPTDLSDEENLPVEPLKRLNSTRRIKKELRTRRSDFLGIEGINDEDLERELTLTKPPDMASILAEERRIEQLHRRSYDTDSNYEQDSSHERDSGVELGLAEDWTKQPVSPDMSQHSRQSSEPFGASVASSEEDEITKKEREIIEVLEKEEQWRYGSDREQNSDIGEKLAHKLRELEEEKMQLERERAQETDLRRQEVTLRMNDENSRKHDDEEMRQQQQQQQQLQLQLQMKQQHEEHREMTRQEQEDAGRVAETAKSVVDEKRTREEELVRMKMEQLKVQEEIAEKERRSAEIRREEEMRIRSMEERIRGQGQMTMSVNEEDEFPSGDALRVERELLQLEQEELKRQRTNMAYREQRQLQLAEQLQEQWQSLQDVANPSTNANNASSQYKYQAAPMNYRSSMPNLQLLEGQRRRPPPPPIPPSKPSRLVEHLQRDATIRNSRIPSADSIPQQVMGGLRHSASATTLSSHAGQQMTKQTLHALSAVPRSRIVKGDQWVQRRKSDVPRGTQEYNYQHWLIQEAEQRRINEKNQRAVVRKPHVTGTSVPYTNTSSSRPDGKPLPDSIIQTLTQRVQNRAQDRPSPPRRRLEQSTSHEHLSSIQHQSPQHVAMLQHQKVQQFSTGTNGDAQEKMLSVSGKKKCSHCGDELGRGAAMIIESLRLFYHMECFKCCVCHVRLGDGLMGTDVRVRNHKLHCHNCYSSDDGVKFSCV